MRVTIIADASFCPDTNVAGYGYWIACERGKDGGGGEMKGRVESSLIAEMQAVVNALYISIRKNLVQANDHVLLQTDCEGAILKFKTGKKKYVTSFEWEVIEVYNRLCSEHSLGITFRHVKGHSSKTEARYITNNLCDRRAKEAMRAARKRVQLNGEFNEQL